MIGNYSWAASSQQCFCLKTKYFVTQNLLCVYMRRAIQTGQLWHKWCYVIEEYFQHIYDMDDTSYVCHFIELYLSRKWFGYLLTFIYFHDMYRRSAGLKRFLIVLNILIYISYVDVDMSVDGQWIFIYNFFSNHNIIIFM